MTREKVSELIVSLIDDLRMDESLAITIEKSSASQRIWSDSIYLSFRLNYEKSSR